MKVISANRIRPFRTKCEHCGSRLKVEPADIRMHTHTDCEACFDCPACRRTNFFGVSSGFWARLTASK